MHFFFDDLVGVAAATPLAVLLLTLPGFGLARFLVSRPAIAEDTDLTCWGLVLGLTLLPATDALLLRWIGMIAVLLVHAGLGASGLRSAFNSAKRIPVVWWAAVGACWLAACWANVDFDWDGRLYQSVMVIDLVKHAAVVGSLAQHGLPLRDPFFSRDGTAGYYYYFYLGPALIRWLCGALVDSRSAFAAATFVTLLAFPAILILVADAAKLIQGARSRFVKITLLLCCLSGFDLLCGLWIWLRTGQLLSQLDWWSEEVRWALTSILLVPHHITAVMAVYTGCLLLAQRNGAHSLIRCATAGLAFATAFGCSVWVAIAAVPILVIWWFYERTQIGTESIWALPLSGLAATLLSLPQISDIEYGRASSGPPLAFYMRPLGPIRVLPHSVAGWIVHLAVTPGGYFIEFGVFALGAILFLTRGGFAQSRSTSIGRLLLVSAPVALVLVTFLRSAILYNDFGWRAIWLAQLPAMVWTASAMTRQPELLRDSPALTASVALGLAATLWDVTGMRLIRPYYFLTFVNQYPEVDYDSRGAYRWIDRNVAADVIVQHNPAAAPRAFDFGLYSDRQVAVADQEAQLFGPSTAAVRARISLIRPVFERPMPRSQLLERATAAHIAGVLLTSADPLWRASGGPPKDWECQYRSAHSCVMLMEKYR